MRVITFGELMLRLAPEGYTRLLDDKRLVATFGGGEANVAVSLANYGIDCAFVTKLPCNAIADSAVRELRGYGVDVSHIVRGGERIGIYYIEKGASVRPSKVIYDREHSAIADARLSDFDFDSIFEGVTWLHFSGITPALSDNMASITLDMLKCAKLHGVTVSCDLNYRRNLWTEDKARHVMTGLMDYVDVLIGNEEDAERIFSVKPDSNDVVGGRLNKNGYASVAEKLTDMYHFEAVAFTLRESISASDNNWSAMLYRDGRAEFSRTYPLHIVDRVGGGDSFAAGLIYGMTTGKSHIDTIEWAVAASALKHTIEGDYNRVSVAEVDRLNDGDMSGRVQR